MQSHTCELSAFAVGAPMAFGAAAMAAVSPKQGTDSFTASGRRRPKSHPTRKPGLWDL